MNAIAIGSSATVPQSPKDSGEAQTDAEPPEEGDIAAERDADTTYHRLLPEVEERQ